MIKFNVLCRHLATGTDNNGDQLHSVAVPLKIFHQRTNPTHT